MSNSKFYNSFLSGAIVLLLTVFLWLPAAIAHAHALQPAYLNIIQRSGNQYEVSWKVPFAGEGSIVPLSEEPEFPDVCQEVTTSAAYQSPAALLKRWTVNCGSEGCCTSSAQIKFDNINNPTDNLNTLYF